MVANLAYRNDEPAVVGVDVVDVVDVVVTDVIVVESAVVDRVPPSHFENLQKGDEMEHPGRPQFALP